MMNERQRELIRLLDIPGILASIERRRNISIAFAVAREEIKRRKQPTDAQEPATDGADNTTD